jgi:hypothetical protein
MERAGDPIFISISEMNVCDRSPARDIQFSVIGDGWLLIGQY